MKKIIHAKPHYQCQNCLAFWREEDLKKIKHHFERVLPGEIMPSGACPVCDAVCHEVDKP